MAKKMGIETGTVKSFSPQTGYGFFTSDGDGDDVYFRIGMMREVMQGHRDNPYFAGRDRGGEVLIGMPVLFLRETEAGGRTWARLWGVRPFWHQERRQIIPIADAVKMIEMRGRLPVQKKAKGEGRKRKKASA